MGFFSWLTCDTNESISNRYSVRGPLTAYVLIPKEFGGGCIKETNYEGYGVFGGRDIFALIANWNKPESCSGNDEEDRDIGIDLYYDRNNPIKYGIKISSEPMTYEDAELSEDCPKKMKRMIMMIGKRRTIMTIGMTKMKTRTMKNN